MEQKNANSPLPPPIVSIDFYIYVRLSLSTVNITSFIYIFLIMRRVHACKPWCDNIRAIHWLLIPVIMIRLLTR